MTAPIIVAAIRGMTLSMLRLRTQQEPSRTSGIRVSGEGRRISA